MAIGELIGTDKPDGMCIGNSSTSKWSYGGATPSAAYTTIAAVATTWAAQTSTATSPLYGYTTSTEAALLSTSVNALIAFCKAKGMVLTA